MVSARARYTIGRFSQITRLTPKALRLYDELGLLRPEEVDGATGYRYYTFAQARRAAAISLLRSVDLPLADIARIVDATTVGEVRVLLSEHRATLEARRAEHERMLREVEQLIQRGDIMEIDARLEELEPATLVTVPFESRMDEIGAAVGEAYQQLFGSLAAGGVAPLGPPLLRYLRHEGEVWSLQAAVAVAPGTAVPTGTAVTEVPAAMAVCAVHRGPYSELGLVYHELNQWATGHGYEATGEMVDVYRNDPTTTPPEQLETEVRLLVRC